MEECDDFKLIECDIPISPATRVPLRPHSNPERSIPNSISAILFRYQLVRIVHEMRASRTDQAHHKDYKLIKSFHDRIVKLLDSLPPFLRSRNPDTSWDTKILSLPHQRVDAMTLANLVIMTLHRPHIAANVISRRIVSQTAMATLESQQQVFSQAPKHHHKLLGLSFYTIDAAILISVITAMEPPGVPVRNYAIRQRIERILRHALLRLTLLQKASPVAKAGLEVLQQCYQSSKKRVH